MCWSAEEAVREQEVGLLPAGESEEERLPGRLKDNSLWDAEGTCEVRERKMEGWFSSRSRRTKHQS